MRVLPSTAAVVTAIVLAGCSPSASEVAEPATVRVGTLIGQAEYFAPFLYEEFTTGGTLVEIVPQDSQSGLADAMSAGSVDFALMGVVSTLTAVAADRDLVVVGSAIEEGTSFMAREGYESLEQLVGRPIGYVAGSVQEVMLRLLIEDAGIDPATVTLVPLDEGSLFAEFETGSIDAFVGTELDGVLAREAGAHDLIDPYTTGVGALNIVLVTDSRHIAQEPETVQSLVSAHAAALAWMADNTDDWIFDMVDSFGGDLLLAGKVADGLAYTAELPSSFSTEIGVLADELVTAGVIDAAPSITLLVDDTFITADQAS